MNRASRVVGVGLVTATGAAYTAVRRAATRLCNTPDPHRGQSLAFPTERTHDVVTVDGARLHVVECGAGPPVLLLHGFGLAVDIWAVLAALLRDAGFRVFAVDQRGFGKSSPAPADFGLPGLAADAAAVVEQLDLLDVTLVGHSMGGVVAQAYALDGAGAADRMRALVLMNTVCDLRHHPFARLFAAAFDSPHLARLLAVEPLGVLLARAGFGHRPALSHLELTRRISAAGNPAHRRGLVGRLLEHDLTERLGSLTVPTLVLGGQADQITPMRVTTRLGGSIGNSRVVCYPGAGHSLMLERSGEVAAEIAGFIERA